MDIHTTGAQSPFCKDMRHVYKIKELPSHHGRLYAVYVFYERPYYTIVCYCKEGAETDGHGRRSI